MTSHITPIHSNATPPLRILMVSDFFYPNTGGVENHIYQLSQCLLSRGHTVIVLTHAYGDIQGIKYLTNGLKVYYIPRLPFFQSDTFPTIFGTFPILRSIINKENINLIHAHQAFSTLAHEAILHARTMGLRVVFTDHSLFGFADASSILINKVLKFTLADVHAAICVSHTSKENTVLRACIPPERVYVIPNAVDTQRFYPDRYYYHNNDSGDVSGKNSDNKSRRRRQQQPLLNTTTTTTTTTTTNTNTSTTNNNNTNDTITIVLMSRLVYRKGIDLLATILPTICQHHPNIQILIGGDGPKRQLLQQCIDESPLLKKKVRLLGAVPHDQVRSVLAQGDIFLNCSLTEAFCMALVEAAAVGLLVVSTNVGGVPEVLPDEILLLAEPSPNGVIAAVDRAVDMIQRNVHMMPTAQHERVSAMYNWPSIAQRTERVYYNVMASERDDGALARFRRFYLCGKWFGKICCCVVAVDWLYWRILELMDW